MNTCTNRQIPEQLAWRKPFVAEVADAATQIDLYHMSHVQLKTQIVKGKRDNLIRQE